MRPSGLPILTYHAFDATGSVTATDPAWFAATLAALTQAGFQAVDLASWIAQGRPPVDRGFALTIDDGLQSIWEVAEVVARYKATATVFVVTDRVGSDNGWPGQPAHVSRERLLSWTDLESLAPLGFRFAAHGRTHRSLDRCDDSQIADELRGSRDAIEQRLGRPCPLFAYPYGRVNRRVHQAARRYFNAAFGTRLDTAGAGQDLHQISRIDAYYLRSTQALDRLVTGRLQGWLRIRRALREGRGALTAPFSRSLARA